MKNFWMEDIDYCVRSGASNKPFTLLRIQKLYIMFKAQKEISKSFQIN